MYLAFPVRPERLRKALEGTAALGMVGVNLTVPHKVAATEFMHELAPAAQALGAVNTVRVDENGLYGDNTDAVGFLLAAREDGVVLRDARAVVYGAGGAARAVVYALLAEHADVTVVNRTIAHAETLLNELASVMPRACAAKVAAPGSSEERDALRSSDLLVNATSLGMSPNVDTSPVNRPDLLRAGMTVMDLVYRPRRTRLLVEAGERGCRCINGVSMLVHQGAESFRIWFGIEPNTFVMRNAVESALDAEESHNATSNDAVAGSMAV